MLLFVMVHINSLQIKMILPLGIMKWHGYQALRYDIFCKVGTAGNWRYSRRNQRYKTMVVRIMYIMLNYITGKNKLPKSVFLCLELMAGNLICDFYAISLILAN